MKADLAAGLGTAAIAKKHCWNKVSVQRAIRKVRSGASLLTKEEELQDHGDSIQLHQGSERERQVAYGNPAGVLRRISRSRYRGPRSVVTCAQRLKKKSVKKVRTFCLREINQQKRKAFCEQLLPRLKLGKARVLAKCRPGIDVRSIVFTDEKFFRLEQGDRKQRVWLDSGTTKKVTLFRVARLFRLCGSNC